MENNSSFWSQSAEWLKELGLPGLSEFEAMLVLLAAFLVIFFILWLAFRKVRLWYWKTDIQIDTLKSIDGRLHNVENKLSLDCFKTPEKEENELSAEDEDVEPSEAAQEKAAPDREGHFAVGRSGRVYTEAELELQIRE